VKLEYVNRSLRAVIGGRGKPWSAQVDFF